MVGSYNITDFQLWESKQLYSTLAILTAWFGHVFWSVISALSVSLPHEGWYRLNPPVKIFEARY